MLRWWATTLSANGGNAWLSQSSHQIIWEKETLEGTSPTADESISLHRLSPPPATSGGPFGYPCCPVGFRDNRGASEPRDMGAEPHRLPTMRNAQGPPSVVNTVYSDSGSTHSGPQGPATGRSVVQRWQSELEPHAEGPKPVGLGSYNHRDTCLAN